MAPEEAAAEAGVLTARAAASLRRADPDRRHPARRAYVAASTFSATHSFLLALVAAVAAAAAVGIAIERLVFRTLYERDHLDQVLATFGLILLLQRDGTHHLGRDGALHSGACLPLRPGGAAAGSLVIEGVFERIPAFKLVLIKSGFAWLPPLAWRLDKLWRRLKEETPYLTRRSRNQEACYNPSPEGGVLRGTPWGSH